MPWIIDKALTADGQARRMLTEDGNRDGALVYYQAWAKVLADIRT